MAYGADAYTAALDDIFRTHFGPRAEVYPVFNGTGSNVVSLQALTDRWQAIVCAESSHAHTDECGAAENVAGIKLLTVPAPDGKLTPELIDTQAWGFDDEHRAQPTVVTLTQSTELGTVYTADELRLVCEHAHSLGMTVHVDGARLSNAAAALDVGLKEITTDVGVDVLSFGGTKNGMLGGEAVVVLNPDAVRGVAYLRKSSMQLASKMRFISAQFHALLCGDLWLRNAAHANAMAARLAERVRSVPGVELTREPEVNSVFAVLPAEIAQRLQKRFRFYTWDHRSGEVRWMTTFDTTEADVDAFAAAIAKESAGGQCGSE
jgi:threonine aldolase